jgi:hypothetical protein
MLKEKANKLGFTPAASLDELCKKSDRLLVAVQTQRGRFRAFSAKAALAEQSCRFLAAASPQKC